MERKRGRAAAPAAVGLWIAIEALLVRVLLRADEQAVYWLGRPLGWVCEFRSRSGLPCPTCGMTRSVVLALHGEIARAWALSPGGVTAAAVVLAFAGALLLLAALRLTRPLAADGFQLRLRKAAFAGVGVVLAIWLTGWAHALAIAARLSL